VIQADAEAGVRNGCLALSPRPSFHRRRVPERLIDTFRLNELWFLLGGDAEFAQLSFTQAIR
jgi:hypothetical protein